jgi:hypothetical protein
MAYKHFTDKKPAAMAAVRAANGAATADIKVEGITNAFKFIKYQLFSGRSKGWHPRQGA